MTKCKLDDLICLLELHQFDYLAVTETWLYPDISDKEVLMPGYQVYRNDRRFTTIGQRGGGVYVFNNNNSFIQLSQQQQRYHIIQYIRKGLF